MLHVQLGAVIWLSSKARPPVGIPAGERVGLWFVCDVPTTTRGRALDVISARYQPLAVRLYLCYLCPSPSVSLVRVWWMAASVWSDRRRGLWCIQNLGV